MFNEQNAKPIYIQDCDKASRLDSVQPCQLTLCLSPQIPSDCASVTYFFWSELNISP